MPGDSACFDSETLATPELMKFYEYDVSFYEKCRWNKTGPCLDFRLESTALENRPSRLTDQAGFAECGRLALASWAILGISGPPRGKECV